MTIDEAIGVAPFDVDINTGQKLTFQEKYARIINVLGGLDAVIPYIPYSFEKIKEALKTDVHLNNLSLWSWDEASGYRYANPYSRTGLICCYNNIWNLYRKAKITSASCADGVCILKETARLWVEREEANK